MTTSPGRDDGISLVDVVVESLTALVGPVDRADILQTLADRTRALVGADEVAILLGQAGGVLRVVSCTSSDAQVLSVLELHPQDGPGSEVARTGSARAVGLAEAAVRWPDWAAVATARGFGSVVAAPLASDGHAIGALVCLLRDAEPPYEVLDAVTALARVSTVVLLFEEERASSRSLTEQLQEALDSRVVIEQAKGIVAAREGVDLVTAFERIRAYSRRHGLRLHDVAARVVAAVTGGPSSRAAVEDLPGFGGPGPVRRPSSTPSGQG